MRADITLLSPVPQPRKGRAGPVGKVGCEFCGSQYAQRVQNHCAGKHELRT